MGEGPSRLSIAVSMGDYQNTKFILGGESPEDFVNTVQTVFGDKANSVLEKYKNAFLEAPYFDVNRGRNNQSQGESAPPPPNNGWGNSGNSGGGNSSSGNNNSRQEDGPGRPSGNAPECEHGPKVWVNPQNKDWKGWFCPERKRAGSCSAEFVND